MRNLSTVLSSFRRGIAVISVLALYAAHANAQNVVIVMIDGARFTESFGAGATYLPRIWKDLRPKGTIYTNFRNEGVTSTCPGHTAVLTGAWQDMPNDGTVRPASPTIFEYFRKQTGSPERSCFVVSGKKKLEMLTHSVDTGFGAPYQASFLAGSTTSDTATWSKLITAMDTYHPRLIIINFPDVDLARHAKEWERYLQSIRGADSLVALLWKKIGADSVYRNTTTMFVTDDHGRHDPAHGDFQNHGDSCEGCRHIMLLAIGPDFPAGTEVNEKHTQIDIAPTVGEIMGFAFPKKEGKSLLPVRKAPSGK